MIIRSERRKCRKTKKRRRTLTNFILTLQGKTWPSCESRRGVPFVFVPGGAGGGRASAARKSGEELVRCFPRASPGAKLFRPDGAEEEADSKALRFIRSHFLTPESGEPGKALREHFCGYHFRVKSGLYL